ncbi:hypothetical protein IIA95_03700, partial [Patescibacteria group bacterium]|nr:hypothetical protein [Patescibacteria group bacterium]
MKKLKRKKIPKLLKRKNLLRNIVKLGIGKMDNTYEGLCKLGRLYVRSLGRAVLEETKLYEDVQRDVREDMGEMSIDILEIR